MEYKKYKLGEICKIFGRIGFRGYTTEDLVLSPSYGAISLSPSNIVDGIMDLSKCTYISWAKYEESPEIKITPNDIVIVKTGNSYGRTAIIRNVEHPMTLNPQFVVLKDIQINPVYLAYFLKTDEFQKQIYGIVGGSAIPTLSQEDLASLIVRVPNENIQNTIADILDSLDGKIELNKLINDNLEAMAKQLYDYWFVQFDFPNEEGKPYKSSGGAMVWNEKLKREIPQGWDSSMLQSICTIKRGASPRPIDDFMDESHKGMPWVKISDATNSNSPFMTTIKEHIILDGVPKSVKVIPNTLIVSNSATPGIPKFIQIEACVHDGWLVLTDYQEIYKYYLYYVIKMIRHNLLHIASGSIFKNLKTDYLKEFICITPSTEILSKYHNLVKPIMQEIFLLQRDTEVLTKQRDELLPLLMNGQASVNYHLSDD